LHDVNNEEAMRTLMAKMNKAKNNVEFLLGLDIDAVEASGPSL